MTKNPHWDGFLDFVAFEAAAGGPSPNLALIAAVPGADLWLACCYAAVYNTPVATLLWKEWPLEVVLETETDEIQRWIEDHKPGLPVHSNRRRTTGSPRKLAAQLRALAAWAAARDLRGPSETYDDLWKEMKSIPGIGRYFGIKLAGTLHRLGIEHAAQYDIRAAGAKNGRRALGRLFPEHEDRRFADSKYGAGDPVREAEEAASVVKAKLAVHGLQPDWFQLEALLCEYEQLCKGRRYPGSTSDKDLSVLAWVEHEFGTAHPAVEATNAARVRALPAHQLDTPLIDGLKPLWSECGYVWSDAIYLRGPSSGLREHPELREQPLTDWVPRTRPS